MPPPPAPRRASSHESSQPTTAVDELADALAPMALGGSMPRPQGLPAAELPLPPPRGSATSASPTLFGFAQAGALATGAATPPSGSGHDLAPASALPPSGEGLPPHLRGRRRGRVKFFNLQKGFGFILDDVPADLEGAEAFVHYTSIRAVRDGPNAFKCLNEDEAVEYNLMRGGKGYQAHDVTGPNGAPNVGSSSRTGASTPAGLGPGAGSPQGGHQLPLAAQYVSMPSSMSPSLSPYMNPYPYGYPSMYPYAMPGMPMPRLDVGQRDQNGQSHDALDASGSPEQYPSGLPGASTGAVGGYYGAPPMHWGQMPQIPLRQPPGLSPMPGPDDAGSSYMAGGPGPASFDQQQAWEAQWAAAREVERAYGIPQLPHQLPQPHQQRRNQQHLPPAQGYASFSGGAGRGRGGRVRYSPE